MTPSKPLSPEAEKFKTTIRTGWVGSEASLYRIAQEFDSHQSARISELEAQRDSYKKGEAFLLTKREELEAQVADLRAINLSLLDCQGGPCDKKCMTCLLAQVEALTKENTHERKVSSKAVNDGVERCRERDAYLLKLQASEERVMLLEARIQEALDIDNAASRLPSLELLAAIPRTHNAIVRVLREAARSLVSTPGGEEGTGVCVKRGLPAQAHVIPHGKTRCVVCFPEPEGEEGKS
jgi:hypothetical protein